MRIAVSSCFLLLLMAAACVSAVSGSGATGGRSKKDKDRKRDRLKQSQQQDTSLCTDEDNSAPIHCTCISGLSHNATSVECWVFTGVSPDHHIWPLFSSQPHLLQLKFFVRPNGLFSFVPTKALRHLTHLRELQIIYATITDIHPYAFANSTTLYDLKLSRNQIVNLHRHAFAHLTNLTELNLEENRIAELHREVFVDLPKLRKLYLAHNNLTVIQEKTFRNLAHLLELELDANYISVLTRDTFTGLGELERLDLSENKIGMLGDLTFSELWVLKELNLEYNQIELISDRAFVGLNHLRKLSLSHNRLAVLSGGLLGGVTTVVHLDLRSNYLKTLTYDSVQPIIHNLRNETSYFYIADNKFLCDCRLAWMHNLRNETKNPTIRNNLEEITCFMGSPDEIEDNNNNNNNNNNNGNGKRERLLPPPPRRRTPATVSSLNVKTSEAVASSVDNQFPDGSNDDYIEGGGDANYDLDDDYDQQQQDSFKNEVTPLHSKNSRMRQLFAIPPKDLPCPQEESPTEAPSTYLQTPGYAGINANATPKSSLLDAVILVITALVYLT